MAKQLKEAYDLTDAEKREGKVELVGRTKAGV